MKKCTKCGIEKDLECFSRSKNGLYGRSSVCKLCQKKWREDNKDHLRQYETMRHQRDHEKRIASMLKYREENKEKLRAYDSARYQKNKDKRREWNAAYREKNSESIRQRHAEYRAKNAEKLRESARIRRAERWRSDEQFKLTLILRNRVITALKKSCAQKNESTLELLGCTVAQLREHLESQFKEGMSWDNYGFYGWHIDHIKPCASFDLTDPEQQRKCFHFSNLQPLWAEENLKKGAKYEEEKVNVEKER